VDENEDILLTIQRELNPKEVIRLDLLNFSASIDPNLRRLKVIHHNIAYPTIENNWPGFFIEL
jgi:hypothetical protein